MITFQSHSKQDSKEPLFHPGGYLDYHHFYTTTDYVFIKGSIFSVMSMIPNIISSEAGDNEVKHRKLKMLVSDEKTFQWSYSLFENGLETIFQIRIYKSLDAIEFPNQYVVEYQYRGGNLLLFNGMFQYTYLKLEKFLKITYSRKFQISETSEFNINKHKLEDIKIFIEYEGLQKIN